MTIDETWEQDTIDFHDVRAAAWSLGARSDPRNAVAVDKHGRIGQHFDVRHFTPPAGARRTATRHDLPRADEQRLQSRSPPPAIGKWM